MSNHITYGLAEGVATITMDDGKVNVMSIEPCCKTSARRSARPKKTAPSSCCAPDAKISFPAGFDLKVFAANDLERSLEMVKPAQSLPCS